MMVVDCAYADGAGAGDARLTWAQQFMWEVVAAAGVEPAQFDFLIVRDLSEQIPIAKAVEFVRGFMLRHPVLRAAIAVTEDGTPVQHVRADGLVRISLFRGRYTDPGQLREVIPGTTITDLCRPLLVVAGALVVGIAVRVSHLATDGWGVRLLTEDLISAPLAGGAGASTPSPVDLARFERSSAGLAVERSATTFATARYTSCPPTMWPGERRRPEPARFWYGELRSSRLVAAMDSLRHQRRLGRAGILAGGLAAVAAVSAGLRSALLFTVSSNRFDPAWRGYPGQLAQEAILHVPIGETVAETMRTAMVEVINSLRVARYAPATMRSIRQHAEFERGVTFDTVGSAVVLNLLTGAPAGAVAVTPDPPTFAWTGSTDQENLGFYLDACQVGTDFLLCIRVDTALMSPAAARAWLFAIEWAVVSSANHDVPVAELRARLATTRDSSPVS